MIRRIAIFALASLVAAPTAWASERAPVKIGVLAFRGGEDALKRWSPTADHLSAAIPSARFEVVPLTPEELNAAVEKSVLGFVLTNTGNYVDLEARHGISRIATLRTPTGSVFGAVIFTRSDRADIKTLKDLKGKSFMAVQPEGFGGLLMAWRELKAHGLDPFKDFKELRFSGFPQDEVAFAVLKGEIDAGTFRTDTLEAMVAEEKIRLRDFHVLNPRSYPGFPFLVSTRLYPEWPFAKLKNTPPELAQAVALALLQMPENAPAARAGGYRGWTVPLDYTPVHEVYRELRLGPYAELGEITIADLAKQYGHWLAAAILVLIVFGLWLLRTEQLVARRTRELSRANAELEREAAERHRAEAEARQRRSELAHVHRLNTMGEMASGFAHELNQPLAAVVNYARGAVRRLKQDAVEPGELLAVLEQVAAQAERAAAIVRRIRAFIRKEEPRHVTLDFNKIVRETAGLMTAEAEREGARLVLDLARPLPRVRADTVQIEQVIVNLVRNAIEAMAESSSPVRDITLRTMFAAGGAVEIAIEDTGPGLPQIGHERLFEPFFTTKADGLGLGLSISHRIVEAHGGRLTAAPRPSGGAIFRFTLPVAGEARHDAA
ncbi:MAG: PhnD/SsuA/transferrin family substrate-binding protein [Rhodospirillales bacterium]|nr:PhnD/SsuA/transferrin family substrate-binding protein [Rhodospirillales bacterium]